MSDVLPVGKLSNELLKEILPDPDKLDDTVLQGPGIGLDCAVVEQGDTCFVYKSDPITFATDEIGWYLVHINANDIATTGAEPKWLILTMLLPENETKAKTVRDISNQVQNTCREIGVALIGGHTEITAGLNRPILIGTMIGEVKKERLVYPSGAVPGDTVLLTKIVPIEGTAVLAREFPERLRDILDETELNNAKNYLYNPGISVLRDGKVAVDTGTIHAMHDPTEGGLAAALWEMAIASGCEIHLNRSAVPVDPVSRKICDSFRIDPLGLLASGSLLISAASEDAENICSALEKVEITCSVIGTVESGDAMVWQVSGNGREPLRHPEQDEIGKAFS